MLRKAIFALLLALCIAAPAAATGVRPYIISQSYNNNTGSATTPNTGTTIVVSNESFTAGHSCTCPAGWTAELGTNGISQGSENLNICMIQTSSGSLTGTTAFQCGGSSSGVFNSVYNLGGTVNNASPTIDNTSSHVNNSTSVVVPAPSLTHDGDITFAFSLSGCVVISPRGLTDWDSTQVTNGAAGQQYDMWSYNYDHTVPRTATFYDYASCGSSDNVAATIFIPGSSDVPASTNHFLPYRDFMQQFTSATSATFVPDPWVKAGDLMKVDIASDQTGTPSGSAPGGWTPALDTGGVTACVSNAGHIHSVYMCSWVKKAGANESSNSYVFSTGGSSSGNTTYTFTAWYSIDTTGAAPYLDAVANTPFGGLSRPAIAPSLTPTQAGDLITNTYLNLFGDAASGGQQFDSDYHFVDNNPDFLAAPTSAESAASAYESAYIQPTTDPTGEHSAFNNKNETNGWASFAQAFKLTAAPARTALGGTGVTEFINPNTTKIQTNAFAGIPTVHWIPYGAVAGDLFVTTREDDDFNTTPFWRSPSDGTLPTIKASSNNGADVVNSSVSALTVANSSDAQYLSFPEPTGNAVISYGIDFDFANATFDKSCATVGASAGPNLTGCALSGLGGPTFDVWVGNHLTGGVGGTGVVGDPGDAVLITSSTTLAPTGLNDWAGWQSKTGSFTPSGTTPGSGTDAFAVSEFSLLASVIPSGSQSVLFGPICGFSGDACGTP